MNSTLVAEKWRCSKCGHVRSYGLRNKNDNLYLSTIYTDGAFLTCINCSTTIVHFHVGEEGQE